MVKLKYQFKDDNFQNYRSFYRVQNEDGSFLPLTVVSHYNYDFWNKKNGKRTYTFYEGDLTDKSDRFFSSPKMEKLVEKYYPEMNWENNFSQKSTFGSLKDLKKALNFLAEKYTEDIA